MKNRIGIIGGGQLARMLIFEAKKMGFHVTVLDPTQQSPGGQVADEQIIADLNDEEAMQTLAAKSDYLTFDWELANPDLLEKLEKEGTSVHPSPATLRIIKDKLKQKEFLQDNGIPVASFLEINTQEDIIHAGKQFGYPLMIKTRFGGYDGKGNIVINDKQGVVWAKKNLPFEKGLYIEKFIPFEKEISIIAARDMQENIAVYPVAENIHNNNILHTTIVPARVDQTIMEKAEQLAREVMQLLNGAGVFGIEMFVTKVRANNHSPLLINEIAPRVHNSGHYTIEATMTSQFEQHIRAITGFPLGKTAMIVPAVAMMNILGQMHGTADIQGLHKALQIAGVSVHIYGKKETKPERKMGHITAIGKTTKEVLNNATKAREYITI